MSENELLLALSEMMDNKLKPLNEKIVKLETDMNIGFDKMDKIKADMNHGFNRINIVLENEIRQDIKLLAESRY